MIGTVATRCKKLYEPGIDKNPIFAYSGSVNKYKRVIWAGFLAGLLTTLLACSPGGGTPTATTPLVPGPQSSSLVSGNISVNAETNLEYAFTVEPTMKDVNVVGSFKTFGGAPNHIEVYIMDDATYKLWVKGRTARILYDSGSLSNGEVNQAITTPGKYYLIFTNYASPSLSPAQQVTVSFDLKWTY